MNLADLEQINERINREPYKHDPPDKDDWRPDAHPDGKDCDSYAVAKGRAVWALGDPSWTIDRQRLACLWINERKRADLGDYHCVAIVRLDDMGDMVMDNCQSRVFSVLDMERLGYIPDRVQEHGGELVWVDWITNQEVA